MLQINTIDLEKFECNNGKYFNSKLNDPSINWDTGWIITHHFATIHLDCIFWNLGSRLKLDWSHWNFKISSQIISTIYYYLIFFSKIFTVEWMSTKEYFLLKAEQNLLKTALTKHIPRNKLWYTSRKESKIKLDFCNLCLPSLL